MNMSATAAAAAKVAKPKKAKTVSHAKPQEQTAPPLPTADKSPEFGNLAPDKIIVRDQVRTEFEEESLRELAADLDFGQAWPGSWTARAYNSGRITLTRRLNMTTSNKPENLNTNPAHDLGQISTNPQPVCLCDHCMRGIYSNEEHWHDSATNRRYCLDCGNQQQSCDHLEVFRFQSYDSDGCGFYLSRCTSCGLVMFDDMA